MFRHIRIATDNIASCLHLPLAENSIWRTIQSYLYSESALGVVDRVFCQRGHFNSNTCKKTSLQETMKGINLDGMSINFCLELF